MKVNLNFAVKADHIIILHVYSDMFFLKFRPAILHPDETIEN